MADAVATKYPRISIEYCTQCHWMLRAAWFAQELLSTFSNSIGEIALQPATGGTFTVHLFHAAESSVDGHVTVQKHLLWDRKAEGSFPEAKELKRRVRDIIDPTRDLGHVDRQKAPTTAPSAPNPKPPKEAAPSKISELSTASLNAPVTSLDLSSMQASLNPLGANVFINDDRGAVQEGGSCPPGEECSESDDR